MNPLCTPRDWQVMALADAIGAIEKGDFDKAKHRLTESKRYGACADQIAELHARVMELEKKSAVDKFDEEQARIGGMPYGTYGGMD